MPVFNSFYLVNNQIGPQLLQQAGPLIPIEISVPTPLAEHLIKSGQSVPNPVNGLALIDTGASITAVDDSVITGLGVNPISVSTVFTPSGSQPQNMYPAKFSFPGTPLPEIEFGAVLGSILKAQGIIALLGRDLLINFILVYNGPGGFITLSY